MQDVTPEALLIGSPGLVTPVAPWCAVLDNIELGLALLSQPWIAGTGLRRADFERHLAELAVSMPLGNVYFQRINRVVAGLEDRGVLRGTGGGRDRRFMLTPQGFAALILNLRVLRTPDPTLDGSEFEFKRELAAMWNLMMDRIFASPPELDLAPAITAFFAEVDQLEVWGRPVITTDVIRDAFSVLRLIDLQQTNVVRLKTQADERFMQTRAQVALLRNVDFSKIDWSAMGEGAAALKDNPALVEMVRAVATSAVPELGVEVQVARYAAYLEYLDGLKRIYARELKVVDIALFRARISGVGA
jgi:hypothetical protein